MRILSAILLIILLSSTVFAQQVVNCPANEPCPVPKYIIKERLPLKLIDSKTATGNLNSLIIFLADQLETNLDANYIQNPVVVTSFPNLNKMKETSNLGRLIAESLMHELQIRRWSVIDVRLVREIIINEEGEFSISRDIKKLKDSYNISGVVTGTYAFTNDSIIVNARAIDIETGVIKSSGQIAIPIDGLESLLLSNQSLQVMKISGAGADTSKKE
ncbi:MAG: FlgO family outer membrane protein [Thermodesulfovibrionales bacterium]|nr:FlgO family outer membrane protein [Thermodesulfovibrionales bacterium]